jgi:hypothetical protein
VVIFHIYVSLTEGKYLSPSWILKELGEVVLPGANPLTWTSQTPYAFGLQLPSTLYTQQVIRQAPGRQGEVDLLLVIKVI